MSSPNTANIVGIYVGTGVTGTRIVNNEIYDDGGGYEGIFPYHAGSVSAPTVICGNYLHGWENAITTGPNVVIEDNYISNLNNNGSDCDSDGIEVYYGGNVAIWGNNIQAWVNGSPRCVNSAVNITATGVPIDDVSINGNWLAGGGFTMDLDSQGGPVTNLSVTNNTWDGTPPTGGATFGAVQKHAGVTVTAGRATCGPTAPSSPSRNERGGVRSARPAS